MAEAVGCRITAAGVEGGQVGSRNEAEVRSREDFHTMLHGYRDGRQVAGAVVQARPRPVRRAG